MYHEYCWILVKSYIIWYDRFDDNVYHKAMDNVTTMVSFEKKMAYLK